MIETAHHSAAATQAVANATPLLSVTGMESAYGRIKALKGISLHVGRGEVVALIGANGAGKTTFLRTVSGVQPMTAGTIEFEGRISAGCGRISASSAESANARRGAWCLVP